jgi:hypothetical protein
MPDGCKATCFGVVTSYILSECFQSLTGFPDEGQLPWIVYTGLVAPTFHPWFHSLYASKLVHFTALQAHHEVLTSSIGKRIVTSYEVLAQEQVR